MRKDWFVVSLPMDAISLCERWGEVPLPPYIHREETANESDREADKERYQTIYASSPGAVAAPTAGLHFTEEIFSRLRARDVTIAPITLHVGAGTFLPIRAKDLREHKMHVERYRIPQETAALISSGMPVIAVGTTVVRALETAAVDVKRVDAGFGTTRLFIRPGYMFQVVDHLLTNFHLPSSTLLMLVCALAGYTKVMDAYRHAVKKEYRFYSYGDAMLVSREGIDLR